MKNVLIVGHGATGACIYNILKQKPNFIYNYNISIWDKAKGAGGRMSTKRYTFPNSSECTVDLGAQYFSLDNEEITKFSKIYDNLFALNLLKPIDENLIANCPNYSASTKHFIAPNGSNSIVKYLTQTLKTVEFGTIVEKIDITDDKCWVSFNKNETRSQLPFDIMILTCPVPQILNITGINELIDQELLEQLKEVEYSSRFALGMFYGDRPEWISNIPVMQYVSQSTSDIIAYISIDTDKRSQDSKHVSVCIHSRAFPYGKTNIDRSTEEIKIDLLQEMKRLYPNMINPNHTDCQKWRYSQCHRSPFDNNGMVIIRKNPFIILGGDGIIGKSGLHNCLISANTISKYISSL